MAVKLANGLTAKQEAFARGVAESGIAAKAYREAYGAAKCKPGVVHTEASKLLRHPQVAERVRALNLAKSEPDHLTTDKIRESVRERLDTLSTTAQQEAVRVRATELLGRLDGVQAFEADRREVTHKRGIDSKDAETVLRAALERALAQLGGAQQQPATALAKPAIDAAYEVVGEQEGAPYDPGVDL